MNVIFKVFSTGLYAFSRSFTSFISSKHKLPQQMINIDWPVDVFDKIPQNKNRQVAKVCSTWMGYKFLLIQNYVHWTIVPWWEEIALEKWTSNNEVIFSSKNVLSSIIHGHYILLISSEKSGNSWLPLRFFSKWIQWAFSPHCRQGCSHKVGAPIKLLGSIDWKKFPLAPKEKEWKNLE